MMKVRALQLLVPSDVVNGNKGVSLLPRSGLLEQVVTPDSKSRAVFSNMKNYRF